MKKETILAVDDDVEIRKVIGQYLEDDGYAVHAVANGSAALEILSQKKVDLILLDLVLPDDNGLTLMAKFRNQRKTPVILISGKSDATDRIVGLEMGADDYLVKPFHMRELSARIKSVLRRTALTAGALQNESGGEVAEVFTFGKWIMNCRKYEVSNDTGESLCLTCGEFELLRALVNAPHRILKRDQLFDMTRGIDYDSYDRAIDIQIGRLRKKLNDNPHAPSLIKTVRGVGYMFIGDVKKVANA